MPSTAPAAGRTAPSVADLPKTPDVVAAAFASDVGVDNEAAATAATAAGSGTTSPASRRRASAASTRSRTRSRRAGATTRSPRASRPRPATCSASSRAGSTLAQVASRSRPQGGDGGRPASAASRPSRRPAEGAARRCSRTAKGCSRRRRRRQAGRARGLHASPTSSIPSSTPTRRTRKRLDDLAAERPTPTTLSANISRGWKTRSASRSTRPR